MIEIREERVADFDEIHDLIQQAFVGMAYSDGTEQDFVRQLRAGENYLPEYALVAEENDEKVGHVMLTRIYIANDKEKTPVLLLAPLCVRHDYRKQGVGAALVASVLEDAALAGERAVFLVGDPAYYGRFGFRPLEQGISLPRTFPVKHLPFVQGCELRLGALAGVPGELQGLE